MKAILPAAAAAAAAVAAALFAGLPSRAAEPPSSQTAGRPHAAHDLSSGEVRKIDRDRRRITLRHGEIKALEMPPMTMVFQVADPAWLEQFKVGDRVAFRAANIDGAFTLIELKPAP